VESEFLVNSIVVLFFFLSLTSSLLVAVHLSRRHLSFPSLPLGSDSVGTHAIHLLIYSFVGCDLLYPYKRTWDMEAGGYRVYKGPEIGARLWGVGGGGINTAVLTYRFVSLSIIKVIRRKSMERQDWEICSQVPTPTGLCLNTLRAIYCF
jgi:hypothetical protein